MDRLQALALFAGLRPRHVRELWEAALPLSPSQLSRGLYLGRAGPLSQGTRWVARHIVKRDFFAKLILDGFGVNVRCRQDGSHELRACRDTPRGVEVDFPFRLGDEGLDYGFHVAGMDLDALPLRDLLRHIEFSRLLEVAPEEELARVGARPGDACEEGDLVVGYMAPLGIGAMAGFPFAVVWDHAPTAAEVESAQAYLRRRRLLDTSCGAQPLAALT